MLNENLFASAVFWLLTLPTILSYIVMAAELVRAANESEDKPERLRLVDPLTIPKFYDFFI